MTNLPIKKLKVILYNGSNQQYSIVFRGKVTRNQILRLLDLCELLGGIPYLEKYESKTKFDRIHELIKKEIPFTWFTSKKIKELYEKTFNESISISTVSTYLSRMTKQGTLYKKKRNYRLIGDLKLEFLRKDNLMSFLKKEE